MLTWMAIKTFFKKTWELIKKYWKTVAAVFYGIGVWLYFRGKSKNIKEVLDVANDSHKKEMEVLISSHTEEIEERDKIISSAQEEAEQELNKLKEDLKKDLAGLAVTGAEKILSREINEEDHKKILDGLAKKL